jgi:hypothetical protein
MQHALAPNRPLTLAPLEVPAYVNGNSLGHVTGSRYSRRELRKHVTGSRYSKRELITTRKYIERQSLCNI